MKKDGRHDDVWSEIQRVFQRSRGSVGHERESLVRRLAGDEKIYETVMRLLDAHDSSAVSLEEIAAKAAQDVLSAQFRAPKH